MPDSNFSLLVTVTQRLLVIVAREVRTALRKVNTAVVSPSSLCKHALSLILFGLLWFIYPLIANQSQGNAVKRSRGDSARQTYKQAYIFLLLSSRIFDVRI